MTNPSNRKGDRAELEAAKLLTDLLGYEVRRALGAGRADDVGDLYGIPNTVIQVKAYRDVTRAVADGLADSERNQANAQALFGAAMIRRPGGRWFFALTPDQFATLWREANL